MLIHRYGCSVARRQIQDSPLPQLKLKGWFYSQTFVYNFHISDEPMNPIKYEEVPTTMSIPSQSQTSPIIHFANVKINEIFICI
jgi:hypothetical protein